MNEENRALIEKVKLATMTALAANVQKAIEEASRELSLQPGGFPSAGAATLNPERAAIAERFAKSLRRQFDVLTGARARKGGGLDYESLSLVEEEDLEAIIALEGMVAHARNTDISEYLSFTTCLNTLFYGVVVDESNNPLDPEQVGEAFREALRPYKLDARSLLIVYRKFNTEVFHHLEAVLEQANDILIEHGVIPNLDMATRNRKLQQRRRTLDRHTTDASNRAFMAAEQERAFTRARSPDMYNMICSMMHSVARAQSRGTPVRAADSAASGLSSAMSRDSLMPLNLKTGMIIGGNRVELLAPDQLFSLLDSEETQLTDAGPIHDLSSLLRDRLKADAHDGAMPAIDGPSSDIINVINAIYKAIDEDVSLPSPIKQLLAQLQITLVKVALSDPQLFENDQHPLRRLINEIAMAGIGWNSTDRAEQDPLFRKMQNIVARAAAGYSGDVALFDELLDEFSVFRRTEESATAQVEATLLTSDERHRRMDQIGDYFRARIQERLLNQQLDPAVDELLMKHFHRFLVKLVLKEGPGGPGWKPVINTIDVLLWTVQPDKQEGDRERYERINRRLLTNLEQGTVPETVPATEPEPEPLADNDPCLQWVDQLPIGDWVEFRGAEVPGIRCTLAARIDTIDKFVFVNRHGVKVVDKSRMGLARECQQGAVKLISDGPVFDRAMETVFSFLRDAQPPAPPAAS